MNLCIDIGNSRIKWGLFSSGKLIRAGASPHAGAKNNLDLFLGEDRLKIQHAGICNVGMQELPSWLREILPGAKFFHPGYSTPIPLKNKYGTPETLGMDRLLVAVGAFMFNGKGPVLVIDCGTALNWEFVNEKGEYPGGGIAPGLEMRFRALHEFTARLPLIQLQKPFELPALTGDSTEKAILSGVVNGFVAEINALVENYNVMAAGQLSVFLTGGDAPFLVNHVKNIKFADPDLLLRGIHAVIQFNFPDA